jgi:hypothetical protein
MRAFVKKGTLSPLKGGRARRCNRIGMPGM